MNQPTQVVMLAQHQQSSQNIGSAVFLKQSLHFFDISQSHSSIPPQPQPDIPKPPSDAKPQEGQPADKPAPAAEPAPPGPKAPETSTSGGVCGFVRGHAHLLFGRGWRVRALLLCWAALSMAPLHRTLIG